MIVTNNKTNLDYNFEKVIQNLKTKKDDLIKSKERTKEDIMYDVFESGVDYDINYFIHKLQTIKNEILTLNLVKDESDIVVKTNTCVIYYSYETDDEYQNRLKIINKQIQEIDEKIADKQKLYNDLKNSIKNTC
jgi:hypothetical protein